VIGAGIVVLPFCVSVLHTTHRFARLFGDVAVPRRSADAPDLGHQPRSVVESSVRLVGILISGSALIAITQPFLPGYTAVIVLGAAVLVLAFLFWRTARSLQGHVRAAAQAVIEVLAAQTATQATDPLAEARDLFPGIGAPIRYELAPESPAIGRSLAELELRSATGATVLAIVRGGEGFAVPDAHAPLQVGDVLALAGTPDAIEAAQHLLTGK
jgi:CPA2 family monovalent cation:H+ antiporter-2